MPFVLIRSFLWQDAFCTYLTLLQLEEGDMWAEVFFLIFWAVQLIADGIGQSPTQRESIAKVRYWQLIENWPSLQTQQRERGKGETIYHRWDKEILVIWRHQGIIHSKTPTKSIHSTCRYKSKTELGEDVNGERVILIWLSRSRIPTATPPHQQKG